MTISPLVRERRHVATLEVVVPVYNEESTLAANINTLVDAMGNYFEGSWRVLIANNGSTDRTLEVAEELANRNPQHVGVLHLTEKGKGRALRAAWLNSDAEVVAFTDVDLSTNLKHLPSLVQPLLDGQAHIATGNRLMRGARVTRNPKREVVSRIYNLTVKMTFPRRRVTDMACGFKALTREAIHQLVPMVEDQTWFFDTELLIRAEQLGYEIHQVPVEWTEDLDSKVRIWRIAATNLKGLARVRWSPPPTRQPKVVTAWSRDPARP